MTAPRFLVLALAADLLWIVVLGTLILKRQLTFLHIVSTSLAILGYLLFDMIVYEGGDLSTLTINKETYKWRGPAYCIASRALSVLNGVLSKRMLLAKGFRERMKEKRLKREIGKIKDEDLTEDLLLKKRNVKKDSVIYKRAYFYKHLNDMYIEEFQKAEMGMSAKRRRSSELTNQSKKKFLEKINRLKRSSIDRLLKTKQAFISKRHSVDTGTYFSDNTYTPSYSKTD